MKLIHSGNERLISPEEVSASVLKEMKAVAEVAILAGSQLMDGTKRLVTPRSRSMM